MALVKGWYAMDRKGREDWEVVDCAQPKRIYAEMDARDHGCSHVGHWTGANWSVLEPIEPGKMRGAVLRLLSLNPTWIAGIAGIVYVVVKSF